MDTNPTWLRLADVADVFVGVATRAPRGAGNPAVQQVLSVRALAGTGIEASAISALECIGRLGDEHVAHTGDILVAARSTRLVAALVPPELDGTPINATLLGVRCQPVLAPRLLLAYLQDPNGRAAIEGLVQTGTAQLNLTVKALRALLVPVPPLADQQRLVALLAAADEAYGAAIEAAAMRHQLARAAVVEKLMRRMDSQGRILKRSTRKR